MKAIFHNRIHAGVRAAVVTSALLSGILVPSDASAGFSIMTADRFFKLVEDITVSSAPRIEGMIRRDYPALPDDVTRMVLRKYPRLHADVYAHFQKNYPTLLIEAEGYLHQQSTPTYRAFMGDLVKRKKDLAARRVNRTDVFWICMDRFPAQKLDVMGHLDRIHPELKFDLLKRVDADYPALKADLFRLMIRQYPGLVWKAAKIWTAESVKKLKSN